MADLATRASEQQAVTVGLTAVMMRDFRAAWPTLDPHRLDRTLPEWIALILALVTRYGRMSATLATDYYEAERIAAKVTGRFTVPFPEMPDEQQVDAVMRWATKSLWPPAPGSGRETIPLLERLPVVQQKAGAAASKLITDVGRGAITGAVERDREAVGWARTAAANACAFCRLLATRRPVYTEETVQFRAHDGCHCLASPLFKGQKWTPSANVTEWRAQYKRASGMKGDAINNFRRVTEGRA